MPATLPAFERAATHDDAALVGQTVTLLARSDQAPFVAVATATADASGNYTFPAQAPINSTRYQVTARGKGSAILFVGVSDVLAAGASATSVPAGGAIAFSGAVSPDKTGHLIYLQRQNAAGGDFHTVQVATVGGGSTYSIVRRVFDPGTQVFRVLIAAVLRTKAQPASRFRSRSPPRR